ncbi:hypothetical protein GCM10010420_18130 [Streptomyces glaucosporus]|uniref:Superoxide dismutase n=1 Tax=Streptomyces glaucosporus TaxID=284044 RepID=A0ABN3I2S3_9ACTN
MTRSHPLPSRRAVLGGAALAALTAAAGAGTAHAAPAPRTTARTASRTAAWPTEIPLPDGFRPEGITISGPYAYLGSLADGSVHRADLRTGEGRIVHEGTAGTAAVGLKADRDGLLYIAGGEQGTAKVVDSRTGRLVAAYRLAEATGHFVNDVALLGDRAWFTDSYDSVLHGVPRGRTGEVRRLPLGGDWSQTPGAFTANGIVGTPDGRGLIVVASLPGRLYRVDPGTGHAAEIALRGADDVAYGDGLLRAGRTLYVVRNRLNLVDVFRLDAGVRSATLLRTITDPRFDVPTTAARLRDRLYLVNARFTTPQTPDTEFTVVAVPL